MNDGVVFLSSFHEAIRGLPDDERLQMYDCILEYGLYGECKELDPVLRSLFTLIKPVIDASQRRYQAAKTNGQKGGRPRKNQTENQNENQNKNQNQNQDIDIDSDIDSDIDIDSDKEIKAAKPPRKKYGEFGWVKLTDDQYNKLLSELGQVELDRCIQYVDEYAEQTGNKRGYKNWYVVIRRCFREGWGRKKEDNCVPDLAWRNEGRN